MPVIFMIRAVTVSIHRLYINIVFCRKGKQKPKVKTEMFDQAGSQDRTTIFKDKNRNSIRSTNLLRV